MMDEAGDLKDECSELDRFLERLYPQDWARRTDFFGWTVADEIMHLHLVDLFGLEALQDPQAFAATAARVRAQLTAGVELSAEMRERFGGLAPQALRVTWRELWLRICNKLSTDDAQRRIPWFGPSMRVRAFACARQMEVWAHGQDIYDLFGIERVNADRIRNICDLGVRTFAWSFENRGELAPVLRPSVTLTAPSGAEWTWNPEGTERISGAAEDFALVVTQRRNVADTRLNVAGAGAGRWMQIAQCFAGRPETPPAPGARAARAAN